MDEQEKNESTEQEVQPQDAPVVVESTPSNVKGWSWGAFMMDPAFIIAIKNYKFLFFYILYLIPVLNFFAIIGIKVYLGLNGRSMASKSPQFVNESEFIGYMKGVDHAGKVLFFFMLAMIGLSFLAMSVGIGMALNSNAF